MRPNWVSFACMRSHQPSSHPLQVGRRFIAMCEQLAGGPIAAMLHAGLLRRLRESITEHLLCRLCARTDPELLELLSGMCGRQGCGIQNLLPKVLRGPFSLAQLRALPILIRRPGSLSKAEEG